MEVVLIQSDIVWANPAANRRHLTELIHQAPKADLFVLPEMFSTGFATKPEGIAESDPADSLKWMKDTAVETGAAIAGSIALNKDGKFYNRFYFVKPDGSVAYADKRHLFTYAGEDKEFTGGNERTIVEWNGVRFLLLVCYDLRFPVWSRNRGDYDAAIYVASWPEVRRYAWDTLTRARAIENQCYVLAVDRCGDDKSLHYNGGTALIDPDGAVISACPDDTEGYASGIIDIQHLAERRKQFPVLDDADNFIIKD